MIRENEGTIVSLDGVSLTLPGPEGAVSILHDITIELRKKESVSIMGASGSGKTSLLMVIAGVEQASAGKIRVAGTDITHFNEDQLALFRRQHIGIVFQNFHLIPTMTAIENIAVGLELAGRKDAIELARAALNEVGLDARAHHYPNQLSGGEQQRVALARACAMHPDLLLADEPTGNLDSETGKRIIDLLFRLQERHGSTLVLVTHDKLLAETTSRTLVMQDGRLHHA